MKMTKKKYIVVLVLITVIILVQITSLLAAESRVISNYESDIGKDISRLIEVSIANKMGVASMLNRMLITEDIADLMLYADQDNQTTKDSLRSLLYGRLEDKYMELQSIGIVQFHFHFPSSESFIRFHKPTMYGDYLENFRESVKQVIATGTPVFGYEEGLSYGGYRYVFPIIKDEKYLGSVEFSYQLKSIVAPVNLTYDTKSILFAKVDKIGSRNVDGSNDGYVIDTGYKGEYISEPEMEDRFSSELGVPLSLFRLVNEKVKASRLSDDRSPAFSYSIKDGVLLWAQSIPLHNVSNEVIGSLVFYKRDDSFVHLIESHDLQLRNSILLTIIVAVLLLISFSAFNEVRKKAIFDSLTNLHSRHAFTESMAERIESGVCMMIDIDDFKLINDVHGHFLGDEVLKAIANLLKHSIRKNDSAIRWGGEEFLVLLKETDLEAGKIRAQKLIQDVEKLSIEGVSVTISIGITILTKAYQKDFNHADQALYKAKMNGKNQVWVYDEDRPIS